VYSFNDDVQRYVAGVEFSATDVQESSFKNADRGPVSVGSLSSQAPARVPVPQSPLTDEETVKKTP
jgi:hypothetical protein